MIHLLIPGVAGLANGLRNVGAANDTPIVRLSERDGRAFEDAVRKQTNVDGVPYDPAIGELLRTATIAGVKFVWPASDDIDPD